VLIQLDLGDMKGVYTILVVGMGRDAREKEAVGPKYIGTLDHALTMLLARFSDVSTSIHERRSGESKTS
jgi:5-carboxymethyl-2-hydroxymuconate isomerase